MGERRAATHQQVQMSVVDDSGELVFRIQKNWTKTEKKPANIWDGSARVKTMNTYMRLVTILSAHIFRSAPRLHRLSPVRRL